MKFLIVCVFALVASSIAGESKKEKRGVFHGDHAITHHQIAHGLPAGHAHITPLTVAHHAVHSVPLAQAAPLAAVSSFVHASPLDQLNAAHLVHPAPAIPIAAAPALAPIVHEHIPSAYAVPVNRVQTVYEKLPVPQPFGVNHVVPASYPVHVQAAPAVAIQHHHEPSLALHASPVAYNLHGHLAGGSVLAGVPIDHHHHGALDHHF